MCLPSFQTGPVVWITYLQGSLALRIQEFHVFVQGAPVAGSIHGHKPVADSTGSHGMLFICFLLQKLPELEQLYLLTIILWYTIAS